MKYQFTTEGSKPQTKYYKVTLLGPTAQEGIVWEDIVSTPLTSEELESFIESRLVGIAEGFHCWVKETPKPVKCIGLDSLARILSNIKPLVVKVRISIDGESKVYSIDAEKLDTLLKSLE